MKPKAGTLVMFLLCAGMHSAIAEGLPATDGTGGSLAPDPGVSPLALDPASACTALKPEGLQARGGYKAVPGAGFRCASGRKPLTTGGAKAHEIRFHAAGTEDGVERLGLELAVYSRENMQRSHRLMVAYATALTARTLHMTLPEAVSDAILGGVVSGRWRVNHREFTLLRKSLSPWGHRLEMTIR